MIYDFAVARRIAENELAPYFALLEAKKAGARVKSFEEAVAWKKEQTKTGDTANEKRS